MPTKSQVLDHSGWFLNPLRFNPFAHFFVGVREGKQRMLRQIRSNLLPLPRYTRRAGLAREADGHDPKFEVQGSKLRKPRTSDFGLRISNRRPSRATRLACQNHERRGGWRELEGDLSKIVAIGKKPLHCLFESFPECVFRLKAKEFFGPADI